MGTNVAGLSTPISYLTARAQTTSVPGFLVTDAWFAAGLRIPAHHHEGATFTVILEGGFEERVSTRRQDCRPGLLVIKPPGETHQDSIVSLGRVIGIEVAPDRAAQLDRYAPRDISYVFDDDAHETACRIARELRHPAGEASQVALEGLALELVAASIRTSPPRGRTGPSWLGRVLESLRDAPCEFTTVAQLARVADVHPVYLARVFKTCYGESLGVYARRLRVRWAADRLISTTEPVGAIANRAGFYDQSHFSRVFAAVMGFTPSKYRCNFSRQKDSAPDGPSNGRPESGPGTTSPAVPASRCSHLH